MAATDSSEHEIESASGCTTAAVYYISASEECDDGYTGWFCEEIELGSSEFESSTDCDDEPQYYYDSKADSSFDSKRENKNRRERERIKSKRKLLTDLDKLIKSSDLLPPEKKAKRFTEVNILVLAYDLIESYQEKIASFGQHSRVPLPFSRAIEIKRLETERSASGGDILQATQTHRCTCNQPDQEQTTQYKDFSSSME